MPRNPDLPCADCGKMMWRSPGRSLAQGQARCWPCRRAHPISTHTLVESTCLVCGQNFSRLKAQPFCSIACSNSRGARRIRAEDDAHLTRQRRESLAPGLTQGQRQRLLHQWKRQAKSCTYCDALATTVDHVLPLVRGGTNHEGNLTACCKRCNSSKGGRTVIEWRTGKRLPPMINPLPWCLPRPRVRKVKAGPALRQCVHCYTLYSGGGYKYCSPECAAQAKLIYDRSRIKVTKTPSNYGTETVARTCDDCGIPFTFIMYSVARARCDECARRKRRRSEQARRRRRASERRTGHTGRGGVIAA